MSALSSKLRLGSGGQIMFQCPGCGIAHAVSVGDGSGPRWGYNGAPERPTFTPSILVRRRHWVPPVTSENLAEFKLAPWDQTEVEDVCHSFVTEGKIQFLADCTHALAGQTVDLPDWESDR